MTEQKADSRGQTSVLCLLLDDLRSGGDDVQVRAVLVSHAINTHFPLKVWADTISFVLLIVVHQGGLPV